MAPAHAILPLGGAWAGECRAQSEPAQPDDAAMLRLCNLGYARDRCPRFPGGPDAVRFTIRARHEETVTVYCVIEKDYLPFAHGPLEVGPQAFPCFGGEIVARLARAYVESYLRRTSS